MKLLKEKNLSDSIINSLPGVFYLVTEQGKFLRWNKNFEEVTQYNASEIALLTPMDFFVEGIKLK
jgi:PAS domain-containing protein